MALSKQTPVKSAPFIVVEPGTDLAQQSRLAGVMEAQSLTRMTQVDRVLHLCDEGERPVVVVASSALFRGAHPETEALELLRQRHPDVPVLVLATPPHVDTLLETLVNTHTPYSKLPMSNDELRHAITGLMARRLPDSSEQSTPIFPAESESLLGRSAAMADVMSQIDQCAATDIPVLICGETGTGKDLAGETIHRRSGRSDAPYVVTHLGAMPPELLGSELFGHEKGAFTGAVERRIGKFEEARNGTIFLDEISTIDEKTQISLLRILEQKRFSRLGGRRTIHCPTRIIAATNEDIPALVAEGRFREDLLYRLDVYRILLPPLRERPTDIPLLAEHFLARYSRVFQKKVRRLSSECLHLLERYPWPGNVRELKNVIQRAVLITSEKKVVGIDALPPRFRAQIQGPDELHFAVGTPLADIESAMIRATLERVPNRSEAARLLGISRRALYNKMSRLGLH